MNAERRKRSWIGLLMAAASLGVLGWILLSGPSESMAAQQSNFMGGEPQCSGQRGSEDAAPAFSSG